MPLTMIKILKGLKIKEKELDFLRAFCRCGKICRFSDLQKMLGGIKSGSLVYLMKKFESVGIVEKIRQGVYVLKLVTPICVGNKNFERAYVGALGLRQGRDKPEPLVAIELLDYWFDRKIIFTTRDALKDWEDFDFSEFDIRLISNEELKNISFMREKIERVLKELIKDYIVIADCTSLNKIFTIALYSLSVDYGVPLIYIYESEKKLIWLQSEDDISKEIFSTV